MKFPLSLMFSAACLVCFEGEGGAGAGDGAGAGAGDGKGKTNSGLLTQDEVNSIVAKEKRAFQAKLDQMAADLAAKPDPTVFQQKIEELSLSLKTKEEQAKAEAEKLKQTAAGREKELVGRAEKAEMRLRDVFIENGLSKAANSAEAFNSDQVVTLLRGLTEVDDQGNVKVKGLTKLEDGSPSLQTPEDAMKWMKDNPEKYGNLFKSNVVGGIGGNSATGGLKPGANGQVDLSKISQEQYRELKKTNPAALGLATTKK